MQGGCVAMDVWENLVAVVMSDYFQLFVIQDDTSPVIQKTLLHFRGDVSFADVAFRARPSSQRDDGAYKSDPVIHLCICDYLGLHALHFRDISFELQNFYDVRRWSSPLPLVANPEFMPYEISPRFGPDCTSISWINAFEVGKGEYSFVNGRLPPVESTPSLCRRSDGEPYFRLVGTFIPALYFHAARDIDEGLGLLVAGNAFGELVVCQFGGLPLHALDGCFKEFRLPPYKSDKSAKVCLFVRVYVYLTEKPSRLRCSRYRCHLFLTEAHIEWWMAWPKSCWSSGSVIVRLYKAVLETTGSPWTPCRYLSTRSGTTFPSGKLRGSRRSTTTACPHPYSSTRHCLALC